MEKNLEVSNFLDFYGELLTDNQKQVLNLYYNEDLSLSEIANNQGITRQGVRDTIKKAESQLFDMENKLHLLKRFNKIQKSMLLIIESADQIKLLSENKNDRIYKLIELIKNTATDIYEE